MRLVSDLFVDLRIEEAILFDVGGEIRRAVLIDASDDAMLRGETLADQIAAGIAECGDEDQLVVAPLRHFAKRIVEQNRS